jgi:hypothetical protein
VIYAAPSTTFEATLTGAPTGLVGTVGVRVLDNAGAETVARTTAGIIEFPAGSGFYSVSLAAPSVPGSYTVMWDTGTVGPATTFTDDLVVTLSPTVDLIAGPSTAPTGGLLARVLWGTSATIAATFSVDGADTDPSPDQATLQLVRAVGTDVLPPLTSTTPGGTGVFTRALTPTQTAQLDSLRALWTATIGSPQTIETRVEVVGGFLFSTPEGIARTGLTAAAVAQLRTAVEQDLERACRGLAFVPRYHLERRPVPRRGSRLRLSHGPVRSVRSVTIAGQAWSASQLATLNLGEGCWVESPYGWFAPWGPQSVVIGYEYGLDAPERTVTDAALTLAAAKAAEGSTGIDPRATQIVTQDGTLVLAPSDGSSFGLPSVDRVVNRWALPMVA